jgi:hypothetical protein
VKVAHEDRKEDTILRVFDVHGITQYELPYILRNSVVPDFLKAAGPLTPLTERIIRAVERRVGSLLGREEHPAGGAAKAITGTTEGTACHVVRTTCRPNFV